MSVAALDAVPSRGVAVTQQEISTTKHLSMIALIEQRFFFMSLFQYIFRIQN